MILRTGPFLAALAVAACSATASPDRAVEMIHEASISIHARTSGGTTRSSRLARVLTGELGPLVPT